MRIDFPFARERRVSHRFGFAAFNAALPRFLGIGFSPRKTMRAMMPLREGGYMFVVRAIFWVGLVALLMPRDPGNEDRLELGADAMMTELARSEEHTSESSHT